MRNQVAKEALEESDGMLGSSDGPSRALLDYMKGVLLDNPAGHCARCRVQYILDDSNPCEIFLDILSMTYNLQGSGETILLWTKPFQKSARARPSLFTMNLLQRHFEGSVLEC